jgi:hypothetical protein
MCGQALYRHFTVKTVKTVKTGVFQSDEPIRRRGQ